MKLKTIQKIISFKKFEGNPILSPRENNPWDCGGSFNPGAIRIRNKTYIVYRAISKNNISVFGLAITKDGFTIDERLDEPIYLPKENFEIHPSIKNKKITTEKKIERSRLNWKYISGGSYCGCEDPRLTRYGNKIFMTYIAFNGISPPRIAITSIKVKDFVEGNFEWEKPKLISHPDIPDKCCVLFPEKFKNKFLFLHRIFPNIWRDYKKSLDFNDGNFIFGKPFIFIRPEKWDSRKIGAGAPPLKTKFGWILIYQAVTGWDPYFYWLGLRPEMFREVGEYKYKLGLMILDKKNPEKVIFRSEKPALIPDKWYEGSIAYSCGAVISNGKIFVYYGGGDWHIAVCTFDVNEIKELVGD